MFELRGSAFACAFIQYFVIVFWKSLARLYIFVFFFRVLFIRLFRILKWNKLNEWMSSTQQLLVVWGLRSSIYSTWTWAITHEIITKDRYGVTVALPFLFSAQKKKEKKKKQNKRQQQRLFFWYQFMSFFELNARNSLVFRSNLKKFSKRKRRKMKKVRRFSFNDNNNSPLITLVSHLICSFVFNFMRLDLSIKKKNKNKNGAYNT